MIHNGTCPASRKIAASKAGKPGGRWKVGSVAPAPNAITPRSARLRATPQYQTLSPSTATRMSLPKNSQASPQHRISMQLKSPDVDDEFKPLPINQLHGSVHSSQHISGKVGITSYISKPETKLPEKDDKPTSSDESIGTIDELPSEYLASLHDQIDLEEVALHWC